ncbi:MAG TPA: Asp-tRNA(Asn)/Glu-tRNA(Gln) amidotransferase subunit GatB [Vicinamibacterales bacterium]|nr:Asp-tRNA(Asn)/Glu-tRNA(Gln) amidotransferase subunit GatB [Vicinamibacterales bacterium]
MSFEAVIGLEIHAQLLTRTKIFCGCSTRFGDPPNTNICPVCLGLPGALPVLNRRAVDLAARAALALGCRLHDRSIFARKNYFYPDLPKGYQISQYDQPLATDGAVEIEGVGSGRRIGIIRVHLEEDAGKSLHEGFADSHAKTYLDYNRSGVPLIEIVTAPDLRSAEDAARFFEWLRSTLVWIGVNDGNMEEGSLRCDANVSVRPVGSSALGTKIEVKNLNSFRYLQKALEYEIGRQIAVVESGGKLVQETRLWDQAGNRTVSMRSKEEAHDYRYFPEPDLPPVSLTPARIAEIEAAMPELPDARRKRFMAEYALSAYDAAELTRAREIADYFEATARRSGNPKAAANWILGELSRKLKETGDRFDRAGITPEALAGLIALVDDGTINSTTAKEVFEKMYGASETAKAIVEREGLAQIRDESALLGPVREVLDKHADAVAQYRGGKKAAFGFLVGQVMRTLGGKASPKLVNELLRRELDRA